jgi:hypothetical protein
MRGNGRERFSLGTQHNYRQEFDPVALAIRKRADKRALVDGLLLGLVIGFVFGLLAFAFYR